MCINKDYQVAGEWVKERAGKPCQVEKVTGTLNTFILEPFLPHPQESEYYICVNSAREGDWILFTHEGGVEVGDVDAKAMKLLIAVDEPVGGMDDSGQDMRLTPITVPIKGNHHLDFAQGGSRIQEGDLVRLLDQALRCLCRPAL